MSEWIRDTKGIERWQINFLYDIHIKMDDTKENMLMVGIIALILILIVVFFWWTYWLVTWTQIKTCEVQRAHNMDISNYCILDE